jgi:hypothetical protein
MPDRLSQITCTAVMSSTETNPFDQYGKPDLGLGSLTFGVLVAVDA